MVRCLDKTERGRAAQALLDNGLLREALAGLDATYTAAWRAATTPEAREDCHRYMKLVEKLTADLTSIATSGALEQARLRELERGKKGMLSWPITM